MKITRLSRMRSHRIYRDFTWPNSLPDFSRFNLIYGWNGAGKTTLSNLFRHLQDKRAVTEGEVRIRIDGNDVSGADIATEALPQIRVFNRDTINRSIFEQPNQALPPVYFLGEDSAEKQQRIELLKAERQALFNEKSGMDSKKKALEKQFEQFRKDKAASIKAMLTSAAAGAYFNSYDAQKFKKKAEDIIASGSYEPLNEVDRAECVAKKEGTPKEKIVLPQASYPDFSGMVQRASSLLSRSVVASTLDALASDAALSQWVSMGLKLHDHVAGERCKFCEQPVPEQRLKALEAHFNDAFLQFQAEISSFTAEVDSAIQFLEKIKVMPDKGLLYPHLSDRYQLKVNELVSQSRMVAMLLGQIRKGLVEKEAKPFLALDITNYLISRPGDDKKDGTLDFLFGLLMTAGSLITGYVGKKAFSDICVILNEHNQYTDNFTREQDDARKLLESDEVVKALPSYQQYLDSIRASGDESAKSLLRMDSLDVEIGGLESAIRQHLKAAEELNRDMASYLGRDELQFVAHDTGYLIRRNGQPANNLSDGERTAVSFIYFLKSLEDTGFDLANGAVVIDDPVSSLDANSIYCAFGFMKSRLKNAGQLFVLTHNFTFFRQVSNWFGQRQKADDRAKRDRDSQMYMLKAVGAGDSRNSGIAALDPLLRDYQSEYHFLFQQVLHASRAQGDDGMEAFYSMPNIARRLLEAVMSFKRPDKAGKLQQQIDGIEGFDEAKRARIIRFTHSYSHHGMVGEPEHDLSILAEGPAILIDVLDLIKHLDPGHHEKMLGMCK